MTKFSELRRTFLKCIALLSLTGCQSYFYFPMKEKLFDPAKIKMQPEDVFLKTQSGNTIHGWYFPATTVTESKGTLLFFHGNAENLTSHFLMFHWLPAKGYNYFIFDYPGYGLSTGKPSPESTVEAGMAAAEWLHLKKDSRPLIIYGHSLGGIVALRTVEEIKNEVPIRNVIIEASFSSYQQMARNVLSRRWFTWPLQPISYVVISDNYAPKSLADISPLPLLFIHGADDYAVELKNSEKMFAAARSPKEFWVIPGGHHGDLYELRNGELRDQLLAYLSKTLTVSK
ncbi:phospholipase [Bdellovibrio bacteriovorus]|uniref:Phospholipase n=1 Tax=Bdellovibrio bacteriovorus TaxID=959 RepID=A0A150WL16_BDEBC|nr:alpha/beta hydrolase [Bdellovibrio bacteriovorus]KYG64477.1 phospholipase [Bdellovibrio bacteriovorus]